jgi:hypothetical protein
MPKTLADLLISLAKSDPGILMKPNGTPNQSAIAARLTSNLIAKGLEGNFNHVRIHGYLNGVEPRQEVRDHLAAALGISREELLSAIRAAAGVVATESDTDVAVAELTARVDKLAADVAELRSQRAADAETIAKVIDAIERLRKAFG